MARYVNASYTNAVPVPLLPNAGLQYLYIPFASTAGTIDSGDVIVLWRTPFALRAFSCLVGMEDDADGTCAATLGYGTDDGTTFTVTDADAIATGINLETEAVTQYLTPVATIPLVIPAGAVLALTLSSGSNVTIGAGHLFIAVQPA